MTSVLRPETEDQLLDAVSGALSANRPLCVRGLGSKDGLGQSAPTDHVLDTSALSGILQYEPSELVLRARAGTPLHEVRSILDQHHQIMAFEPVDIGRILNASSADDGSGGTIGGMVAAALAGPARIRYGGVRDHVLGFHAVSGRAEVFKSGGNVMKNVTGFDLSKLMAGSMGTLAVMSAVTIKVVPAPEKTRTILIYGLADEDAIKAMACAANSPCEITAAGHLPKGVAARSGVDLVTEAGASVTVIRIEGPAPSVSSRCASLKDLLHYFGEVEELHSMRSARLWKEFGNIGVLTDPDGDDTIWRVSVPPRAGADVANNILNECGGSVMYDWAGGLLWIALPGDQDQQHEAVRGHLNATTGHATLVRASESTRRVTPVFHPQSPGVAALSRRIKEVFDPHNILNPGRMYPDM